MKAQIDVQLKPSWTRLAGNVHSAGSRPALLTFTLMFGGIHVFVVANGMFHRDGTP